MRGRLGGDGETEMVGKDGMRNEYPTDFTNYKPNSLKVPIFEQMPSFLQNP